MSFFEKKNSSGREIGALLIGAVVGAGAMFLLDPAGRRRRALVKSKLTALGNRTIKSLDREYRHLRNKGQGLLAETGLLATSDHAEETAPVEETLH